MTSHVANKELTEIELAIKPESSSTVLTSLTCVILSPDLFSDCLPKELEWAWHGQREEDNRMT